MMDFDQGQELLNSYGGSENKTKVKLSGTVYMVKYPDPIRSKNVKISYKNNHFSEHIGCQIFKSCGFHTQDTVLGYKTTYKGVRKLVVGCVDFTVDGSNLYEMKHLGNAVTSVSRTSFSDVEAVMQLIDEYPLIKEKESIKNSFWDMFIIDALIGNVDRHVGNWGLVQKNEEIKFAPIYDCGSSLAALKADEEMARLLEHPADLKNEEISAASCYRLAGKKMVYREVFNQPFDELKASIIRTVGKIDIKKINEIIDSTKGMSTTRKDFLKQSIKIRYETFIYPAYKKLVKE